ncbi:MAG TPA: carboxypeptidase-like regulatory domain-containing protein [Gemmataceae bacterium]|nr:carboxypeptidase-like regulatory domain-containing protein [Gemmataceae bacterium]
MTRRHIVLPTLALAVVLFAPSFAAAHDLRATVKVEADVIRVEADYEGEIPVQDGSVTLTDANGSVVASGKTDDRGVWTCPRPSPGSYTLVVEQAGHRDRKEFTVSGDGKTATVSPDRLDKRTGLLIGLGVLLGASLLFWFARRKPANGATS